MKYAKMAALVLLGFLLKACDVFGAQAWGQQQWVPVGPNRWQLVEQQQQPQPQNADVGRKKLPAGPLDAAQVEAGTLGNPPTGVKMPTWDDRRNCITFGNREASGDGDKCNVTALPEDAGKGHIVVIGDKAFRDDAKARISKIANADKFHVGYFEDKDWQVAGIGLVNKGITILEPADEKGKARSAHFQDDLDGIEKAIDAAAGLLRRRLPDFDPRKIIDLRKFTPSNLVWAEVEKAVKPALFGVAWLGIAGVSALSLRKRR